MVDLFDCTRSLLIGEIGMAHDLYAAGVKDPSTHARLAKVYAFVATALDFLGKTPDELFEPEAPTGAPSTTKGCARALKYLGAT